MGNNSLISKIVFFTGVLLIGALLVFTYVQRNHRDSLAKEKQIRQEQRAAGTVSPAVTPTEAKAKVIATAPSALTAEEQKKWTALREIMLSKNDNDPRLDKDLRSTSAIFHSELVRQYQNLPMESRNERGLIAFLIARDIKDSQDMDFLKSIYEEKPCLSLEDCTTPTHSDPHLSSLDQTSANYPQMATLYQLENQLNAGNKLLQDDNFKDRLKQIIDRASQYPVPMVQRKAEAIRNSHPL